MCFSTICREIERPSPVPPAFVVKNCSKRCFCCSAESPGPWSRTDSCTNPAAESVIGTDDCRGQFHDAADGRRIDSILKDIEDDLLDLLRINMDERKISASGRHKADFVLLYGRCNKAKNLGNQIVHLMLFQHGRRHAGKIQRILNHCFNPLGTFQCIAQ